MSETNQDPSASDDGSNSQGGNPDGNQNKNGSDEQTDYKAEVARLRAQNDDIIKSRNSEKTKRKELESRLQALEDATRQQQSAKDEAEGNVESLKKRFSARETELVNQLAEKDRHIQRYVIREEIMKLANDKAEDPELLCEILESRVKVSGFDDRTGRPQFDVADDWGSIGDLIDNYLDQKPYLKKSGRKPGTGDDGGSDKIRGKTAQQIASSPDRGRETFSKDPEAARQFLREQAKNLVRGR